MNKGKGGEERIEAFRRNRELETLLGELNDALWFAEQRLLPSAEPEFPLIFIVGPHRSGSTLLMQWLADMGKFAYPTNLLSRFFGSPILGSKIQLLLTDERYNYRNEILDFSTKLDFVSDNGKTTGALAPNEFWYFWRRFLPFDELDYLPTPELEAQVDTRTLIAELAGIVATHRKPLVMKGLILNYNIDFLERLFTNSLFIYSRREPLANIASAVNARLRQYGNVDQWYSFKIPEYPQLSQLEPYAQVAGQIYHINRAVEAGLEQLPAHRRMTVDYEDFCRNPSRYYAELRDRLAALGHELEPEYSGPEAFEASRTKVTDPAVIEAYSRFYNEVES